VGVFRNFEEGRDRKMPADEIGCIVGLGHILSTRIMLIVLAISGGFARNILISVRRLLG